MRLTLRTLLAYLDDTLDPTQTKAIGQKVAESDAAQELIARIKQVTRRRRLTTPPATGPGAKVDANTIAEYLDNVLPAEQLAAVEETCLASDVHLAEVAACHQILTLVLGEPALVPPVARQRMYGLIQGREAIPYRKPPASTLPSQDEDRPLVLPDEVDDALLLGLPLYRRHGAQLGWLVPVAALFLLVASALALRMALPSRQVLVAQGEEPVAPVEVQVAAAQPAVQAKTLPEPKPEPETKLAPEPKPEPDAKVVPEPKPQPEPKPAVAPVPPAPPPASGAPAASPERREIGKYVLPVMASPSVLLQQPADKGPWQRVRPENRIFTTDTLVSLPGYRSELRTDSNMRLVLWGDLPEFSRMRVLESTATLYSNPDVDLDFRLERGRVALSNHKDTGPARIRLRYLNNVWDLTLQDNTTEAVLVQISFYQPEARFYNMPDNESWEAGVILFLLKGQAELKIHDRAYALPSPSVFTWSNKEAQPAAPQPMKGLPDWWTNKLTPQTPAAKAAVVALEELSKRLSGKAAVDVVLTENLRDPDPGTRILAVRCLGAINDLTKLLDALSDERYREVRLVAIDVLRQWIALRPDHDLKLFQMLRDQKNYTEGQADIFITLLHDFSGEQINNPTTYETLLAYLLHEKLPIRELAYWHLSRLVPAGDKKIRYDPAGSPEQREQSFQLWKKLIPDGKLPPKSAGG